jgi:hypothetical protein
MEVQSLASCPGLPVSTDANLEKLTADLKLLMITIRRTIRQLPYLMGGPSAYKPKTEPPGFVYLTQGLTFEQRVHCLLHELTHAALHPPGSGTGTEAEGREEEPSCRAAATAICEAYGVDHGAVMESLGADPQYAVGGDQTRVDLIVARLGAALRSPSKYPAHWLPPEPLD